MDAPTPTPAPGDGKPQGGFAHRVHQRVRATGSHLCLGIDPRPEDHPLTHPDRVQGDPARVARNVVAFYRSVLQGALPYLACCKLQSAFFEAMGIPGMIALAQLLADARELGLPAILDAKRGDIGSTAEAYARAYLAGGVFAADALTVNPYLGMDALEPFVAAAERSGRAAFVLVRTSNPGSADLQELELADGRPLYLGLVERLAERARRSPADADGYTAVAAVVGATQPGALGRVRERLPRSLLLLPGYGAQGGRAADAAAAVDARGLGAIVSASRSLARLPGDDHAGLRRAAAEAASAMHGELEAALRPSQR